VKKILLVSKDQFGYLIDTYKYCEYLKDVYDISLICLDWKKPKIELEGINVKYIEMKKGKVIKFLYFAYCTIKDILLEKYDFIFCVYFRFCCFLTLFIPQSKIILDIRTGSVSKNIFKRIISNIELKINSIFFRRITIISESLANNLKIRKYEILPLGADRIVSTRKQFKGLKILYIGTFDNRRLEDTIIGYKMFVDKYGNEVESKYTIIGSGTNSEEEKLKKIVKDFNLDGKIFFLGYIKNTELSEYLAEHNIGISYVPITNYYNCQPPTKTYEYLMNGLICLATKTYENKKIISDKNGILIDDNPENFFKGLESIYFNLKSYDSDEIICSVQNFNWENISNCLVSYINRE